ncbi:hypothetical protein BaRGS_00031577 [Batillaria attramentaria]|uniref:Uncharacterized protein n=1 Tax=Batillaria attramentaria TaxID=370345 RepID=A0ABD0JQN4_9CAEN
MRFNTQPSQLLLLLQTNPLAVLTTISRTRRVSGPDLCRASAQSTKAGIPRALQQINNLSTVLLVCGTGRPRESSGIG